MFQSFPTQFWRFDIQLDQTHSGIHLASFDDIWPLVIFNVLNIYMIYIYILKHHHWWFQQPLCFMKIAPIPRCNSCWIPTYLLSAEAGPDLQWHGGWTEEDHSWWFLDGFLMILDDFWMIPDDFWRLQGRLSWDGLKHAVGRTLNLWLGLHHQGSYH